MRRGRGRGDTTPFAPVTPASSGLAAVAAPQLLDALEVALRLAEPLLRAAIDLVGLALDVVRPGVTGRGWCAAALAAGGAHRAER